MVLNASVAHLAVTQYVLSDSVRGWLEILSTRHA